MATVHDNNPDDLMNHFRGRSLKSILIFTLIVHLVVIGGSSIPFLIEEFTGPNKDKMSDEDRAKLAVKEASIAIQKIAEAYNMQPQQLSDQLAGGRRAAKAAAASDDEPAADPETPDPATTDPKTGDPGQEKSQYEKDLEKKLPAPDLPPVEQADDLFK